MKRFFLCAMMISIIGIKIRAQEELGLSLPFYHQKSIYPSDWVEGAASPPYDFWALINASVPRCFSTTMLCQKNTGLQVLVEGQASCSVYFFKEDAPQVYSISKKTAFRESSQVWYCKLLPSIPESGTYRLVVVSSSPSSTTSCNILVGTHGWSNISTGNLTINCNLQTGVDYTSFTCNSTLSTRPMICLIGGDGIGSVIATSYTNTSPSDYDWSHDAYMISNLSDSVDRAIVFYPTTQSHIPILSNADIYIGCKTDSTICLNYPNCLPNDIIVSAPYCSIYSNISWAGGRWHYWEDPRNTFSQYYSPDTLEAFDAYFADCGLTRNGATEDNSVVDVWKRLDANIIQTCVKSKTNDYALGKDWESKIDLDHRRFFHPRNALNTYSIYNLHFPFSIYARYKQSSSVSNRGVDDFNNVYANVIFTDFELSVINNQISQINRDSVELFSTLFDSINSSYPEKLTSNEYNQLYDLCLRVPSLKYVLYKKLDEGCFLAVHMIESLYVLGNMEYKECIQSIRDANKLTSKSNKLIFTPIANARLFVKKLLGCYSDKSGVKLLQNDDDFKVEVKNKSAIVSINIEKDSHVDCFITSETNRVVRDIIHKQLKKGSHSVRIDIGETGLYLFSCVINGNIHTKKVYIR